MMDDDDDLDDLDLHDDCWMMMIWIWMIIWMI
jgi:hypothetical protein